MSSESKIDSDHKRESSCSIGTACSSTLESQNASLGLIPGIGRRLRVFVQAAARPDSAASSQSMEGVDSVLSEPPPERPPTSQETTNTSSSPPEIETPRSPSRSLSSSQARLQTDLDFLKTPSSLQALGDSANIGFVTPPTTGQPLSQTHPSSSLTPKTLVASSSIASSAEYTSMWGVNVISIGLDSVINNVLYNLRSAPDHSIFHPQIHDDLMQFRRLREIQLKKPALTNNSITDNQNSVIFLNKLLIEAYNEVNPLNEDGTAVPYELWRYNKIDEIEALRLQMIKSRRMVKAAIGKALAHK